MDKKSFLDDIRDGKWFEVRGVYGGKYAVKMKTTETADSNDYIDTLWLSKNDPESMCFSGYNMNCWDIRDDVFITFGSDVYNFGLADASDGHSIYDENSGLVEKKMFETILKHANKDFIKEKELLEVWKKVCSDCIDYELLPFK